MAASGLRCGRQVLLRVCQAESFFLALGLSTSGVWAQQVQNMGCLLVTLEGSVALRHVESSFSNQESNMPPLQCKVDP